MSKLKTTEASVFWGIIKAVFALYVGSIVFQALMYSLFPPEDDLTRKFRESEQSIKQSLDSIGNTLDCMETDSCQF